MYSRKDGSSNEEIFQKEFEANALVSWIIIRASWISISLVFKDPLMNYGSWE